MLAIVMWMPLPTHERRAAVSELATVFASDRTLWKRVLRA